MYTEFMNLCIDPNFDKAKAYDVLSNMDVSKGFEMRPKWKDKTFPSCAFTPLSMAVYYNNLAMVELLLSLGSDPNVIYNDENVLWDLQYNDGETAKENEIRLIIARRLLENGANPKIVLDGENLYQYVLYCSEDDIGELADYRMKFLFLLEEFIKYA